MTEPLSKSEAIALVSGGAIGGALGSVLFGLSWPKPIIVAPMAGILAFLTILMILMARDILHQDSEAKSNGTR